MSDCTKTQIVEGFKEDGIEITRPLVTRYINQLIKSGVDIKTKTNNKRENLYGVEKRENELDFSQEEFAVISDVKKLLISQKKQDRIRKTMLAFYKVARYIKNNENIRKFIDFGYYSTINWCLVLQLEEHCEKKDIIVLDYILPQGGNKFITIQADRLDISKYSQRLYLHGILKNSKHFSHLPVDRIYMVKNVVEENAKMELVANSVTYTVSRKMYDKLFVDEKEEIVKIEGDKITLKRPTDDEFYLLQRLLYFCPEIYYISDERIKTLFKEKLELVRALYKNEIDR